jgi:putative membrane-bound dehydrogenase-like protein
MQTAVRTLVAIVTIILSTAALPVDAQGAPQGQPPAPDATRDLTREFAIPEGLQATLWAESPQFYNPTAIDVDARGRVWVAEAVNYRKWEGRNPGLAHPEGDRILILEDTDGDGKCDSSKIFVQERELVAPLGICVLGNQVLVSCSPNAILYTDVDGDDKPDRREVFLTGFGGFDHDHALHSFVPGPDGTLYFNAGNAGPHIVTDRSGWKLRSGSLYNGGGPTTVDNKPGLVSDDGRVWTGGLVMKIGLDGTGLRVLAHNFRNNYEAALDSFGNIFQDDNDDDGNQACRTLWVMEGGNHGYFSADGSRYWNADRRPGQDTITAHWHQDDPGVVPMGTINGAGGPTGVCVYEGELLKQWIGGAVLDCDAGANVVYAHRPTPAGAGIALEKTVLLGMAASRETANPRANSYRPSDVCTAPDGSVYVADWFDPIVGGHLMYDKVGYGRILRIAPRGNTYHKPGAPQAGIAGWMEQLRSPALSVRFLAIRALRAAGESAVPALLECARTGDPAHRARALFVLAGMGKDARAAAVAALADPDANLRIAALRALRSAGVRDSELLALAAPLAADPSPAVRRELALGLRDVPFADCKEVLLALASKLDAADRYEVEALGIACTGKESDVYNELKLRASRDAQTWGPRLPTLAWRLHPAESLPWHRARAMDESLTFKERRMSVDAIAFMPARDAADAMLQISLAGAPDVRGLAAWWLRHRDTNDWRMYGLGKSLVGNPDAAISKYSSGLVKSGLRDVEVDITGARSIWLVVTDGGDGNGCDWADWIEPEISGPAGRLKLATLPWTSATAEWGSVNINKNANGGALRVAGKEYSHSIGTHARSEICYVLPEGYTKFTARVGPDDGGTSQQGGRTSIEFSVRVETPPDRSALIALQHTLVDGHQPDEARADAAEKLAMDPEGAQFLFKLATGKKLSKALKEKVTGAIYNNPDWSIRALAGRYFPRKAAGGAALPPPEELLAIRGDARRGQSVFFGDTAGCYKCHSFQGRGGDIGPDLSQIRAKYQKPQLLDAILNPSAGIAFGFDTWMLTAKNGQVLVGFIQADGAQVVVKDTQGKRHVFAADDIVEREKQKVSAMPDGIALGLDPASIADLVEFLSFDWNAPPKLGEPVTLFNGKDLQGWTYHLSDPNVAMGDVWSVKDGLLTCKGQPAGYIRTLADYTNYVLTLEWKFDPKKPGNSGVLLRMTGKDKVWPKSIEAQLMSRNAGDIWNIDEVPMMVDPARTEGRRTAKLQPCNEKPLGEWNTYEITLNRGELRLVVNGILQNWAHWCEEVPGKICLQSEGAEIIFRNIVLRPIVD